MRIHQIFFWRMYELEFSGTEITIKNINDFLETTGIEDYIESDDHYYELNFNDPRKWYMFKMKHGIVFPENV